MPNPRSSAYFLKTKLVIALICALPTLGHTRTYTLPASELDLLGESSTIALKQATPLSQIAVNEGIGFDALFAANNHFPIDEIPAGSTITLPVNYIIPDVEREGIVINLPELRLYFFHSDKKSISVYPIGIGRTGWDTPVMKSSVSSVRKNPTWTPPDSIRKAYRKDGIELPASIPPGPENPLGSYAMRLGNTNYLIHGTSTPQGVGRRVSSGCIRLYEADIAELAKLITPGTPVQIVNQPIKWARESNVDYIEAHQPLANIVSIDDIDGSAIKNANSISEKRKHALHHGFRKAEQVAGIEARKKAEHFAHGQQTKHQLFTGLPQRVAVKTKP